MNIATVMPGMESSQSEIQTKSFHPKQADIAILFTSILNHNLSNIQLSAHIFLISVQDQLHGAGYILELFGENCDLK